MSTQNLFSSLSLSNKHIGNRVTGAYKDKYNKCFTHLLSDPSRPAKPQTNQEISNQWLNERLSEVLLQGGELKIAEETIELLD